MLMLLNLKLQHGTLIIVFILMSPVDKVGITAVKIFIWILN